MTNLAKGGSSFDHNEIDSNAGNPSSAASKDKAILVLTSVTPFLIVVLGLFSFIFTDFSYFHHVSLWDITYSSSADDGYVKPSAVPQILWSFGTAFVLIGSIAMMGLTGMPKRAIWVQLSSIIAVLIVSIFLIISNPFIVNTAAMKSWAQERYGVEISNNKDSMSPDDTKLKKASLLVNFKLDKEVIPMITSDGDYICAVSSDGSKTKFFLYDADCKNELPIVKTTKN